MNKGLCLPIIFLSLFPPIEHAHNVLWVVLRLDVYIYIYKVFVLFICSASTIGRIIDSVLIAVFPCYVALVFNRLPYIHKWISMDSSEDTISDEGVDGQMKPVLLLNNPDFVINPAQVGYSHPMVGWTVCSWTFLNGWLLIATYFFQARAPYPFADPYFSGILTTYGSQLPVSFIEHIVFHFFWLQDTFKKKKKKRHQYVTR